MGSRQTAAKRSFTNWYWFYTYYAQVCPLLRRT
jgi:hypothetical protein